MKKRADFLKKNITWILPAITAGLFALLLFSILVPKKVIDTYKTNVTEEEGDKEYLIPMEQEVPIIYEMNTGSRPMRGIHIAVAKNGGAFEKGAIICNIFSKDKNVLVSENRYVLYQGEDIQYVYIPFSDYEACSGAIEIQFIYDSEGNTANESPGLLANGRTVKDTVTKVDGQTIKGSLKTMYVYTHNTYPLVYDLRILTLLFFAASMTIPFKKISIKCADGSQR